MAYPSNDEMKKFQDIVDQWQVAPVFEFKLKVRYKDVNAVRQFLLQPYANARWSPDRAVPKFKEYFGFFNKVFVINRPANYAANILDFSISNSIPITIVPNGEKFFWPAPVTTFKDNVRDSVVLTLDHDSIKIVPMSGNTARVADSIFSWQTELQRESCFPEKKVEILDTLGKDLVAMLAKIDPVFKYPAIARAKKSEDSSEVSKLTAAVEKLTSKANQAVVDQAEATKQVFDSLKNGKLDQLLKATSGPIKDDLIYGALAVGKQASDFRDADVDRIAESTKKSITNTKQIVDSINAEVKDITTKHKKKAK